MGIIKKLFKGIEDLSNRIKILESKLNRLKIRVDLVNDKPKQLPDAFTYKPQQPYGISSKKADSPFAIYFPDEE